MQSTTKINQNQNISGYYSDNQAKPQHLAEIQGLLCGLICSGVQSDGKAWIESLLGNLQQNDSDVPMQREVIIDLYKNIAMALQHTEFDLMPLLAYSPASLNTRAQSLSKWCYGFLCGLDQAGLPIRQEAPSIELFEALQRFSDISRLDYDKIEIREDDETTFNEVVKFIQNAVVQIYHLLNHDKAKH